MDLFDEPQLVDLFEEPGDLPDVEEELVEHIVPTEEAYLGDFVKVFLKGLADRAAAEDDKQNHPYNRFQAVLVYGHNADRLRRLVYLFAQHIAIIHFEDVHILRSSHLPHLVGKYTGCRMFEKMEDVNYLSFLKITYPNSREAILDHLLGMDNTKYSMTPGGIVVDDVTSWIRSTQKPRVEDRKDSTDPGPSHQPKAGPSKQPETSYKSTQPKPQPFRDPDAARDYKFHIVNLYRLLAVINETANFCGQKMAPSKPKPDQEKKSYKCVVVITLDLGHFYRTLFQDVPPPEDETERRDLEKQILDNLVKRYFDFKLDADEI